MAANAAKAEQSSHESDHLTTSNSLRLSFTVATASSPALIWCFVPLTVHSTLPSKSPAVTFCSCTRRYPAVPLTPIDVPPARNDTSSLSLTGLVTLKNISPLLSVSKSFFLEALLISTELSLSSFTALSSSIWKYSVVFSPVVTV